MTPILAELRIDCVEFIVVEQRNVTLHPRVRTRLFDVLSDFLALLVVQRSYGRECHDNVLLVELVLDGRDLVFPTFAHPT